MLKLILLIVVVSAVVNWIMLALIAKNLEKYIGPITNSIEKLIDAKISLRNNSFNK